MAVVSKLVCVTNITTIASNKRGVRPPERLPMWYDKEQQASEAYWKAQAKFENRQRMLDKGWGDVQQTEKKYSDEWWQGVVDFNKRGQE